MGQGLRSLVGSVSFVAAAAAVSLIAGVAATTNRAGPLLGALLMVTICALALRGPWIGAVGLAPTFLLPYSAMTDQAPYGLHVVPLLTLFVLAYGAAAWVVTRDRVNQDVGLPMLAIGLLAVSTGVAEAITRGTPKDTAYTTGLWLGALLVGHAARAYGDEAVIRVALGTIPLALLALYEAIDTRNVWGSVVGPLLYEEASPFRATSTFGHPLVAGTAFVIVALMVLSTGRGLASILAATLFLAAGATLSRSPVLGAAVGAVVLLLQRNRTRARVLASIGLVAIGLVIALDIAPQIASSARTRLFHAETSSTVRLQSLDRFAHTLRSNPETLLLPQDRNRATTAAVQSSVVDDQYITLAYDAGLLAAILAVMAIVIAGHRRRWGSNQMLAPILGALAMLAFFEGLYWPSTGSLFWFAIGFGLTDRSAGADEPARQRPSST